MIDKVLLIVTGLPATGKTALGETLAKELGLPFIYKDGIKETLFDALGTGDLEWSHKLGSATYELFDYLLGALMPVGISLVLESNFEAGKSEKSIAKLIKKHDYIVVQVLCKTEGTTLVERFEERANSGERHPGHVDDLDRMRPVLMKGRIEPLPLDGPLIEIDTTDFDALDNDEIVKSVKDAIDGERGRKKR